MRVWGKGGVGLQVGVGMGGFTDSHVGGFGGMMELTYGLTGFAINGFREWACEGVLGHVE